MAMSPYDQQVYDAGFKFIPQTQYLQNPFVIPQDDTDTTDPNTGAGIITLPVGGGGGGGGAYTGGIDDLVQNYELDTRNQYFNSQPTPLVDDLYQSKLDKTFMGFPSYRQIDQIGPFTPYNKPMDMDDPGASIENIIASRNVPLELTRAGRIQESLGNVKEGIGSFADTVGGFGPVSFFLNKMDRMNTLPELDQQFIKQSMGYTGPTVFGENTGGGYVDPFGVNVRSAFGNYAEKVRSDFEKLSETLGTGGKISEKYGVSYDPVTGEFTGRPEDIEKFKQMNKMNLAKLNFRYKQIQQQEFDKKIAAQKAKDEAARQAAFDQARSDRDRAVSSGLDAAIREGRDTSGFDRPSSGAYAEGAGMGVGGGYGSDFGFLKDGGRVQYMDGGLADLVDIYD
jgi:hypothetical protein